MSLSLLLAAIALIVLIAWKVQPRREYTPDPDDPLDDGSTAPIDREELERAEREVRGWSATATPEHEDPKDDWGPGTKER